MMYTLFCCSQKLVSFVLLVMIILIDNHKVFILVSHEKTKKQLKRKTKDLQEFPFHKKKKKKKKKSSWDSFLKDQFFFIYVLGLGLAYVWREGAHSRVCCYSFESIDCPINSYR